MNPEIEKIIKEQMKILPPEVINILADPAFGEKIINIGKKNILNEVQLVILQQETNLVLLGLVHPDEYENELKNRLKIDEMKVNNILSDVNREILGGVREKLVGLFNVSDESLTYEERKALEKKANWKQNLDFILSGGDYSVFMDSMPEEVDSSTKDREGISGYTIDTPPKIMDTKNKFLYDNDKSI